MKNLKLFGFALISFMFMGVAQVNAEVIEVSELSVLKTCLDTDGNTCKLTSNIELDEPIEITEDVVLDLNGYIVTMNYASKTNALFEVLRGAKLTINDSSEAKTGVISAGTSGNIYAAVVLTKSGEGADGEVASLVVNGGTLEGYYYGIVGNGSRHNTSIEINGGTITGKGTVNLGIYHPQNGTLTINGGTITGLTGLEMRAGTLVVNGGEIIGTDTEVSSNPNGNGSTTFGAGIAIAQHTSGNEINVTINGGVIQGKVALYESTPEANPVPEKISISVTGGEFEAINGGTTAVYSENLVEFIDGGTYSSSVIDYMSKDVVSKEVNGVVLVGNENKVTLNATVNGSVAVNTETAVVGEKVNLTLTPEEGYEIDQIIVVDANNNEIRVEDNSFVMPNSDVTVTVTYREIGSGVTALDDNLDNQDNTDATDDGVPETGDDVSLYITLGTISIAMIALTLNNLKKRAIR